MVEGTLCYYLVPAFMGTIGLAWAIVVNTCAKHERDKVERKIVKTCYIR